MCDPARLVRGKRRACVTFTMTLLGDEDVCGLLDRALVFEPGSDEVIWEFTEEQTEGMLPGFSAAHRDAALDVIMQMASLLA